MVVVGRVQRFATDDRPPLLFYCGRYASADDAPQPLTSLARAVAAVA